MPRALKAFSQVEPRNLQVAAPKTNSFTLDLGGLHLSDGQLTHIRQQAVKAAMLAAAAALGRAGVASLDDFGTFSTFSTFSTFGSGSFGEFAVNPAAQLVIDKVLQSGAVGG
jgi:hypothetical protein